METKFSVSKHYQPHYGKHKHAKLLFETCGYRKTTHVKQKRHRNLTIL